MIRWLFRLALAVALALAGVLTVAFVDANWRFAHLEAAAPARVFSAPFALAEGTPVRRDDLLERLGRLGYRRVEGHPQTPGEYAVRFRSYEIFLNAFDYPEGRFPETPVRIRVGFGQRIGGVDHAETGTALAGVRLEPEMIGVLSGNVREQRLPVAIDDLPETLRRAVIAVEDRRFYRHPGIDPWALLRALFVNVKSGEVVQGGSTITQQLAKNLYPDPTSRNVPRKIWETLAALGIEALHSKDEILERYLNQIYMAQRGPISVIGVGAAARHYFGKDARYLDLQESALLAGLIQSPGRYHPYRHPRAARDRRNLTLRLMREEEFISTKQEQEAAAAPLQLRAESSGDPRQAPYFIDFVAQELLRLNLRDPASQQGLRVFSTLDPLLQARAQTLVAASLKTYEKQYRHLRPLPGGEIQGAFVALRPADGAVLAMIGGRDYTKSQFNRVTQAHRQPGSLFKPFVYLAGFQRSRDEHAAVFTAATVLDDSPFELEVNGEIWAPQNFDREYRGAVTAREALARSLNIPTIRAAELIGLRDVVRMARRCGITSPLQAVPSIALGTFEVTPLEIAAAFTPIANLGARVDPHVVTSIVDDAGAVREVERPAPQEVISPEAAYMTLDLMRDVVRYGTGAGIWGYGVEGEFAGKTGTTDDGRDNWFVGLNPAYLGLAWVGFDNNRPLKLGGSVLALPIWAQLAARSGLDVRRAWTAPPGIVEEEVDPTTGLLASWRCPDSTGEIFFSDAVPAPCEDHGSGFSNWAREVIDWFRRD